MKSPNNAITPYRCPLVEGGMWVGVWVGDVYLAEPLDIHVVQRLVTRQNCKEHALQFLLIEQDAPQNEQNAVMCREANHSVQSL